MDSKYTVEVTGDTVEAAITAGLQELGVGPTEVMVEVLEEPSRGVFGIGARPALVRLKLLRLPAPPPPPVPEPSPADYVDDDDEGEEEAEQADFDDADMGEVGRQLLAELLKKMGIRADIRVTPPDPDSSEERTAWVLDIHGPDMRVLVGRRGEVLNSLQYLIRLMVSRKMQRRANIVVDAGEYKAQRLQRLRQLANRMADQAISQKRTIYLEPMPPNERRIIHMELRSRGDVTTKSVGEGNTRKVTIVPKS